MHCKSWNTLSTTNCMWKNDVPYKKVVVFSSLANFAVFGYFLREFGYRFIFPPDNPPASRSVKRLLHSVNALTQTTINNACDRSCHKSIDLQNTKGTNVSVFMSLMLIESVRKEKQVSLSVLQNLFSDMRRHWMHYNWFSLFLWILWSICFVMQFYVSVSWN